jgi:uncharacterized membrane protein (UPF0136 family)
MWFLASVLTTLGAAYLYDRSEKSSAEIATVSVAIALVAAVLALIAAPWPIQLGLLTLAFISSRYKQPGLFS